MTMSRIRPSTKVPHGLAKAHMKVAQVRLPDSSLLDSAGRSFSACLAQRHPKGLGSVQCTAGTAVCSSAVAIFVRIHGTSANKMPATTRVMIAFTR